MAENVTEKLSELTTEGVPTAELSKNKQAKLLRKANKAVKKAEFKEKAAAEPKEPKAASEQKAKPKMEKKKKEDKEEEAEEEEQLEEVKILDKDAIFKEGHLRDIYNERPEKTVITRFPPEPNGYLHLGHSKALVINFGFAKYYGEVNGTECRTNLRFDDTNPEEEEEKYFLAIEEIVRWLGFKPHKITYASDNFDRLYELAEELIKKGLAYVCHCTDEERTLQKGGEDRKVKTKRFRCKHASQDVDTNLLQFRGMQNGTYEPQDCFLRMKQDIESDNPQLWDIAAYRILKTEKAHHRTGKKWRIYPNYDFAHGLCDSIEGITHSLCTMEFQNSRVSYNWLNEKLGVYEPMQREYGRLNLEGTIMSKRKLKKVVETGKINGWDDPRIYTLIALRRRGIPPEAILSFVHETGVSKNVVHIQTTKFEQSVRQFLEKTVPRVMLVLDPIPVVIQNIGHHSDKETEVPFHKDIDLGKYKIRTTSTIFIDRSDFEENPPKDFRRLKPGGTVGLVHFPASPPHQYPTPIRVVSFSKDEISGRVTEIQAVLDPEAKKPKAFIQWASKDAQRVEARIYRPLFNSKNPEKIVDEESKGSKDAFLRDINPNSKIIYHEALVDHGFGEVRRTGPWPKSNAEAESTRPETTRFQATRIGYFAMDSDTTDDKVVLNQIVTLKEDTKKEK